MIYWTAPFSITLNDAYPQFQGHTILWRWISQKRYKMQTWFQWNTNRNLHMPYSAVSFCMRLIDLENYSMTRSIARLFATAELFVVLIIALLSPYRKCTWPVVSAYAAWHQMVPICSERWCTEANEATQTHYNNPVAPAYTVIYVHGWQRRCQEDPVSLPSSRLEKTTGHPRITWLSTVQQDLKQHHLTLPEAADLSQNRPLWRMMSTYGATQS